MIPTQETGSGTDAERVTGGELSVKDFKTAIVSMLKSLTEKMSIINE